MKKLMIGLALTAMAASPAFAQYSASSHARTAGVPGDGQHYILHKKQMHAGYQSYAYMPQEGYAPVASPMGHSPMWQSPNDVYVNGEYRGTDPDPLIRMQLRDSSPADAS